MSNVSFFFSSSEFGDGRPQEFEIKKIEKRGQKKVNRNKEPSYEEQLLQEHKRIFKEVFLL